MTSTESHPESVLEKLKKEITCPLCLDLFVDPRRLPCDHVYCQKCIHQLFLRSLDRTTIKCPECRTPTQVPDNHVSNFPTPYHINRLKEVYERGLPAQEHTDSGHMDTSPKDKHLLCPVHTSEHLNIYCESCEKIVCRDCALFSCARSSHNYGSVEDVFERYTTELNDKLHPAKELLQHMTDAFEHLTAVEHKLESEESKKMAEVEAGFHVLVEVLHREKKRVSESIADKFQSSKTDASTKKLEVARMKSDLEDLITSVSGAHLHESKATYLGEMKSREHCIQAVIKDPLTMSSPSVNVPSIGVSMLSEKQLEKICKERNFQYDVNDPMGCYFDGTVDWNNIPLKSHTRVTLYLNDDKKKALPRSSKLHAYLLCQQTKEKEILKVVESHSKSCVLILSPKNRGKHELYISYGGISICESPIQVCVSVNPVQFRSSPPLLAVKMSLPMGIKCSEGQIYVSELKRGLAVLEPCTLRRLDYIQMSDVWEVFIDDKAHHIYGTSSRQHRLKKLTMHGGVLKVAGERGTEVGKFNFPNGIRCSRNNEIFICDCNNDRIQVFDKDLNFIRMITTFDGRSFNCPDDLDFDSTGNIYVASQSDNCIQVLTPEGKYIRTIGAGFLRDPMSVAIDRGLAYVTDHGNKRISVFTLEGECVTTFGEGVLNGPECIAIDENGYIYISDGRSKVYVY